MPAIYEFDCTRYEAPFDLFGNRVVIIGIKFQIKGNVYMSVWHYTSMKKNFNEVSSFLNGVRSVSSYWFQLEWFSWYTTTTTTTIITTTAAATIFVKMLHHSLFIRLGLKHTLVFNGNNNDSYGNLWRKQFIVKFYDQCYCHIETSQLIFVRSNLI